MTDGDPSAAGHGGSRLQSINSHLTHANPPPARVSSAAITRNIAPNGQATSGHSARTRERQAVTREPPHNPPAHFRNRPSQPPGRTPGQTPGQTIEAFSRIAVPPETLTWRTQQTAGPAPSQARDLFQTQGRLPQAMTASRITAAQAPIHEVQSPPAQPNQAPGDTCHTSRKPTCRTAIPPSTASRSTHLNKSISPPQNSRPPRPPNRTAEAEATPPAATPQNRITDEIRESGWSRPFQACVGPVEERRFNAA